jgi:hypothetical protein
MAPSLQEPDLQNTDFSTGTYRIDFLKTYACPVTSVRDFSNTSNPPTPEVHQRFHCDHNFYVRSYLPGYLSPLDQKFQFVTRHHARCRPRIAEVKTLSPN